MSLAISSPLSTLQTSPSLPPHFVDDVDHVSSEDEDDIIVPSSKRRKILSPPGNTSAEMAVLGASKLSNANVHSTPTRRSARRSKKPSYTSQNAESMSSSQRMASVDISSPARNFSNLGSAETSDDDHIMATQPNVRRQQKQAIVRDDPFVVADDDIQYLSSDDNNAPRKPLRSRRRNEDDFIVDNDEVEYVTSDDQAPQIVASTKTKTSKNSVKSPKTPNQRSRREQEELEEDLLDLQDSDNGENSTRSRTRGGPVTTQRDKTREHLERLKKRRAGHKPSRIIDSDDDAPVNDDGDEGADIDTIGRETNRIEILSDSSIHDDDETRNQSTTIVDDYDDDFIVEDMATEGRLGRPSSDIPLQFTSFASAKPKELFPNIVEWMVKNKISPAFNRDDDVYRISFSRLDDQVKAQAGSRLISSAWNATFKYAILARPNIHVTTLPGLDEDNIRSCDACNRTNHPAKYEFTFSGKPYFKETLEPVEDSDDENEEDFQDFASRDEQGHQLASEGTHFYLGRYCAANAEMGHKLTHWKHHLNGQVLGYLEEQDVLSAEAIVNREKLNKKKREKEAENIVDMMQETGMVTELWQGFQDDLEDAMIGMEGHERKGGRGKGRIGTVRVHHRDGTIGQWTDGGKYQHLGQLESESDGG